MLQQSPRPQSLADVKRDFQVVGIDDGARAIDELVQLVRQHAGSDTVPIACMQIERLGAEKPLGCAGL